MNMLLDDWASLISMVPVLPSSLARQIGLHGGWALVLAALVSGLLPSRLTRLRWALASVAALAALVPGPMGVAYWLGLSFQLPSLASMGLACWRLFGRPAWPMPSRTGLLLALAGVGLGWLLLLDTLALLPWAVYPWGYGTAMLAGLLVLALLLSVISAGRPVAMAAVLLAAVFSLTRLPSGNLWDALLDPWLWLLAHGVVIRAGWRWLGVKKSV